MNGPAVESNADRIVRFVARVMGSDIPEGVLESARLAITDWFGVAIGASEETAILAIQETVAAWGCDGRARMLHGPSAAAAPAALVNATMSHCLDFDDTHVGSIAHLTGPVWAASYAVGTQTGAGADKVLRAYLAGFEVGGRLGSGGFGVAVNERRTHSTGVFGCIGAAAAAAALLDLDAERMKCALGLAATQVSGLTESFGTPGKPFHAGKAAFNGVLAAELARNGFAGATDLLEPDGGLAKALVQDRSSTPTHLDFEEGWEITRNTIKPYASCLLTHPVIDACRALHDQLGPGVGRVERIVLCINPLSIQIAGKASPRTPYEGKFSLAFCAALALAGRDVSQGDFHENTLADPDIAALTAAVVLEPDPDMDLRASTVRITITGADEVVKHVPLARGNPGHPLGWEDMRSKFMSLAQPILGADADRLFAQLRRIGKDPHLPLVTRRQVAA